MGKAGRLTTIVLNQGRYLLLLAIPTLSFAFILSNASSVRAAAGDVDPTFNPGLGVADAAINTAKIVVQPDGKVLVGGNFRLANNSPRGSIVRFDSAGGLDTSFLDTGAELYGEVFEIALQPDGKILVGGDLFRADGTRNDIARLNPDGTLDTSFHASIVGAPNIANVNTIVLQPDGKILLGGSFTQVNGTLRSNIVRLNADGSIDSSLLATISGGQAFVSRILRQPDGRIVIAGSFTQVDGVLRENIARLNADGSLDASFLAPEMSSNAQVFELGLQPDGKLLVCGFFSLNGSQRKNFVRLNSDGTLDSSFVAILDGPVGPDFSSVFTLALQPDSKIVIGGGFTSVNNTSRNRIARLNTDGSLDSTFLATGSGADFNIFSLALQLDGKVLITGNFASFNGTQLNEVARLSDTGVLDLSFNPGQLFRAGFVLSMATQPDGRIVIGGTFISVNGTPRSKIARLNSDGSLDTSFITSVSDPVFAITLQSDGKILIGGRFNQVNGVTRNQIARLDANGSLDTTFLATGSGVSGDVTAIVMQPDGKVLIGGSFTQVHGVTRNRVARLNSDGSLDTTFLAVGSGANDDSSALALQPDGKILLGGIFTQFNGAEHNRLVRLNADGTVDASFLGSGANQSVTALTLQSDGKVLIGGNFTSVNGTPRNHIARLNPDGAIDNAFLSVDSGTNDTVKAIVVQPDGKIFIGGFFNSVNNALRSAIARLKSDGSLDETYINFSSGPNGGVDALALQPNGRVLIGGNFSFVNGVFRAGVARLTTDLQPNPIDSTANFVTQHYRDFLNREPDSSGLQFWTNEITSCGADAQCVEVKRINVSAAFFLSIEFQQTGYFVYKTYKAAFGDLPGKTVPIQRQTFILDTRSIGNGIIVGQGNWQQQLEDNKNAYVVSFVQRSDFMTRYPAGITADKFVDSLFMNAGVTPTVTERQAAISAFGSGDNVGRATSLRLVADSNTLQQSEFNKAFVLEQYFGYLKRNPDDLPDTDFSGYNFWLAKLNQFNGNFVQAEMVKAFISSIEYRQRFGQP
jgi:uncharacterized delta-60 repeat protein